MPSWVTLASRPWAAAIGLDVSQDTGTGSPHLADLTFKDPEHIVVHAMADGQWGGTQFRVRAATPGATVKQPPILNFSHGGYQQARGATLNSKNWHTGTHRPYPSRRRPLPPSLSFSRALARFVFAGALVYSASRVL